MNDISVVIPVRSGSSRIQEKVFLPFENGMNLVEWKINQIKMVHPAERIFLSSDSRRVENIANETGVGFLRRSSYLCEGHKATFSEVIKGVVADLPTPYFAWVTVVVPLMQPSEYLEAFTMFCDHVIAKKEYDSLVSVNLMKDYLWTTESALNYEANCNHEVSQNLPDIFRVTNGLYMRAKEPTLTEGYFLGPRPYKHIVGKIAGIDIDELEDYEVALALRHIVPKPDV
jgi:N-acylneuraminate cytidylyltransferase